MTGFQHENITDQATHILKTTRAVLKRIVINKPLASGVITVYDNPAGTGTKVATITRPAALLNESPVSLKFDALCLNGLTIVTSGANQDITVIYS